MEERIAGILAEFARRMNFDAEALREANRKQAMVPEGADGDQPGGHRARAWSSRSTTGRP